MEFGTATQLITVGATLSGVVLTLLANAYLERRRARDTRELEPMPLDAEHSTWLQEERTKACAGLSLAGEEVERAAIARSSAHSCAEVGVRFGRAGSTR
ncbi:hypothetical protein [Streptomyces sp. NPDC090036]|uniref:hypothetical protein n=1 Tax=Streptomyces sp. NPDC090036 TaxID=3365926 RepID=UPI00380FD4BB